MSYTYVDSSYSVHAKSMDQAMHTAQDEAKNTFPVEDKDIEIKRIDCEPDVAGLTLYTVEMVITLRTEGEEEEDDDD